MGRDHHLHLKGSTAHFTMRPKPSTYARFWYAAKSSEAITAGFTVALCLKDVSMLTV